MPNNWANSAFQQDSGGLKQGISLMSYDRIDINTFPTGNMEPSLGLATANSSSSSRVTASLLYAQKMQNLSLP